VITDVLDEAQVKGLDLSDEEIIDRVRAEGESMLPFDNTVFRQAFLTDVVDEVMDRAFLPRKGGRDAS